MNDEELKGLFDDELQEFINEMQDRQYVPPVTKKTIDDYVEHGYMPGHFVWAVLENDLMKAFGAADSNNTKYMRNICAYVYNDIPSVCHGSPEKVRDWLQMHADRREEMKNANRD